jgi:ammonium transporter, Amt family
MMIDSSLLDSVWVLGCAALVFGMQAGFLCLESGLTRSKNSINVAMKNLADFSVSFLLFWAFGFAVMFGASQNGWFGWGEFFPTLSQEPLKVSTFFLFQAMFCATASTIVSGAAAERMRFSSYMVVTVVVSGLVYPVFGHWAWGGIVAEGKGWLASLGFVDFAGSTVVHGVGAWSALAVSLVIGPRAGRFATGAAARKISGSNLPLAMLGTLLLWVGWVGFNGGSTLAMNGQVAGVICNTLLAGAAGMVTATLLGMSQGRKADVNLAINGSLAGLVAITAGCHAVASFSAVTIGVIASIVMMAAEKLLHRCRIDDAVGAIPVHGFAGLWGTLAVGLFGSLDSLNTGLSRWEQIQAQAIGASVAFAGVFGVTYVVFRLANSVVPFRVSKHEEEVGLNIAEHGASTETLDLVMEMEVQRHSGDFSQKITVEPGSELGQVAAQYNRVLERVNEESEFANTMAENANEARQESEKSKVELELRVNELSQFNDLSVGRELRMIELKREINDMSVAAGHKSKYAICAPIDDKVRQ